MKKFLIFILIGASVVLTSCSKEVSKNNSEGDNSSVVESSSIKNNESNEENSEKQENNSQSVKETENGDTTSKKDDQYKEEDFINLINKNRDIYMIDVNPEDRITLTNGESEYGFAAVKGDYLDYKKLEEYVLKTWNSMNDFNGKDDLKIFIDKGGKSYKLEINYRGALENIGLVSDIKKEDGYISAKVAVIGVEDTITDGPMSEYSILNLKCIDKDGLKLINYDMSDSMRNVNNDMKALLAQKDKMDKGEFEKNKEYLNKIYKALTSTKEGDELINKISA